MLKNVSIQWKVLFYSFVISLSFSYRNHFRYLAVLKIRMLKDARQQANVINFFFMNLYKHIRVSKTIVNSHFKVCYFKLGLNVLVFYLYQDKKFIQFKIQPRTATLQFLKPLLTLTVSPEFSQPMNIPGQEGQLTSHDKSQSLTYLDKSRGFLIKSQNI